MNGKILDTVTVGNSTLAMKYDSNGLRTKKGSIKYYYDSSNNLIGMVNGSNTLLFYYDESGSQTSFSHKGTMYFYIKNLQGDICKIVDASGSVIANYTYDAWGKLLSVKDSAGNPITCSSNIALLNPLRYRGYVYDDETGLYYLQSRYYDPTIGRFINADILFDTESDSPLSTNMFAYCENDCINNVDNNGYTYYQYSYYRARAESKYLVTVTFYYSNSSVVVNFTVNRGFVSLSLANQSKKDKKYVYKNLNNYYAFSKLFTHGDTYLLAHAIYKITKRISKGYLKGRTMGGIHTELLIHYACYILGIRRSSTHQIDIGASLGNIGYDDNAWAFETAYFASLAWKAIRNGANFIGRYILRHIMYL